MSKEPRLSAPFKAGMKWVWVVVKVGAVLFTMLWAWQVYRVLSLWAYPMAERELGHGVRATVWKDRHPSELAPIVGLLELSFIQSITLRFSFGDGLFIEHGYDILDDVHIDELSATTDGEEVIVLRNGSPVAGVSVRRRR